MRRDSRRLRTVLALLFAVAAFTTDARAQGKAAPLPEWLGGHWVMELGDRRVEEGWLEPRGGAMFGVGRTVRGDRLVEFEYLRIVSRGDTLLFIAQPNGIPPTEFRLTERTAKSVRFENRAHDFPQVVRYWSDGPDTLTAEVSGLVQGAERAIQFGYRRKGSTGAAGKAR